MSVTPAKTILLGVSPALVFVAAGQAAATRDLYGRSLHLKLADDVQLFVRFHELLVAEADLQLRVRCEGHVFDLQIVHADALADIELALSPQIPEGLRRAAILAATDSLWRALEAWLGFPVDLVSAQARQPAWSGAQALGMTIQIKPSRLELDTHCRMLLRTGHPESWRALLQATSKRLEVITSAANTRLDATVLCNCLPLSLDELQDLQAGDVLVLEAPFNQRRGVPVFLAVGSVRVPSIRGLWQSPLFRVTAISASSGAGPQDTSRRHAMNPLDSTESFQSDGTASSQSNVPFNAVEKGMHGHQGLGSLQMSVQVEVARLSMALSDLQNLTVGQVFDTEQPIDGASVVLWCSGRRLGEGQLVAIGDRLGVRLMSMPGEGNPTHSNAALAEAESVHATD